MYQKLCSLLLALRVPGVDHTMLTPDARLVEDLGVDSLKLVDLTLGVEEQLGLRDFSLQDWLDGEVRCGRAPTLGALAAACEARARGAYERAESVG